MPEVAIITSYCNKSAIYFTTCTDLQKCSKSTVLVLFAVFVLLVFCVQYLLRSSSRYGSWYSGFAIDVAPPFSD